MNGLPLINFLSTWFRRKNSTCKFVLFIQKVNRFSNLSSKSKTYLILSQTSPCSICSTSLLKTLWEKEKLLVTLVISPFPTVFSTLLENCLFYPSEELSAIFIEFEIVVCKLFQFGGV